MGISVTEFAVASPEVIERIRASIMPNGRGRVSEFVEDRQLAVLFGKTATSKPYLRDASIRSMFNRYDSRNIIPDAAARANEYFLANGRYSQGYYGDKDCLNAYTIHEFSENVLKLQLILLDLLSLGAFPTKLDVLDIGIGTGTTAIAVLDFLRLWADACRDDDALPITDLTIRGVEREPAVWDKANRVLQEYAYIIEQRFLKPGSKLASKPSSTTKTAMRTMDDIYIWAKRGIKQECCDIRSTPVRFLG
jgi:hypothetical protein